ncbi:MAG TPA: bifunctional DNA-binding transcriptional regulator/O6-methylguanine-DNA methyltransferase Ada [Gemmatimonadaceae bacterium]|nr:bifunctional DNA-binding transcriptional regulator/O6-methylguanine-DNA methyltransferase Ada [Gemmatimonadaceae bacterium]
MQTAMHPTIYRPSHAARGAALSPRDGGSAVKARRLVLNDPAADTPPSAEARMAAPADDTMEMWRAVEARDGAWDGRFVYAVTSTGVYCRPSCPSRRPRRRNVRFFEAPAAAEREGFRACRRCRPSDQPRAVECATRARELLDAHLASGEDGRITLAALGERVGMSPFHLQRVFKSLFGLTPAEYQRARRSDRFKAELKRGETVSRATYGAGFGSSSRAYEVAESHLGMTPATYRRGGEGVTIHHRTVPCSYGHLLVAATDRGLCAVMLGDDPAALERDLAAEYPRAALERGADCGAPLGEWVDAIVSYLDAEGAPPVLPLDVRATAFQWRVWRALQEIPPGETRSYAEVAAAIGAPSAVRAVAGACANNRVALVIPCHRVVRTGGELAGYRWGVERKRRLLEGERARSAPPAAGRSS